MIPVRSLPLTGLLALAFHLALAGSSAAIPVVWEVGAGGNGHTYEVVVVGSPILWADARAAAQAKGPGWDLASLTSLEESDFVKSLFSGDPSAFVDPSLCVGSNCPGPWLGGLDVNGATNFLWLSGEPVTFTDWAAGEPAANGDVIAYGDFSAPNGGTGIAWNDFPGDVLRQDTPISYVAELVPEPSTFLLLATGLLGFTKLRPRR